MGKWIWPAGLEPLWEDDGSTDKEMANLQERELKDAIAKYYAEAGGGDTVLDPDVEKELDRRELKRVRDMASNYMARNRVSLLDKFMESDLVKTALANENDPKEIREWAGKLLGLGDLRPSDIEDAVAKSLKGDRTILDALPVKAKSQLQSLALREVYRKMELNRLNGIRSRELQGYNPMLANVPIEDWMVDRERRRLESLMLANMAAGRGAVVPVYGSGNVTVEIPGLEGVDMSSMDDKILMHMLGEFRTSGYLPEVLGTDGLDPHELTRELDKTIGTVTGKDIVASDTRTPADKVTAEEFYKDALEQTAANNRINTELKRREAIKKNKEHQKTVANIQNGIAATQATLEKNRELVASWTNDPIYREAYESYMDGSFLPEDWELGYPFAIRYPDVSSNRLIVFEEDGSFPIIVPKGTKEYKKFLPYVYEVDTTSDSRMKKRKYKQKGMTNLGRLGSFLSSSQFRIGE